MLTLLSLLTGSLLYAQQGPCLLGTGQDTETIIQVFQLNDEQQVQLREWSLELQIRQAEISEEAGALLEAHPAEGTAALDSLALEYGELRNQLMNLQADFDTRVLALFNTRQYERYLALCREVNRVPLEASRPE